MKVFISWSGQKSKKFAEVIRNWLPAVLQAVKPYFTPSDLEKGTRWISDIAKELESSDIGILCVTRDNIHSDWIMFEAGALSKSLEKPYVCPILFGINNTDLSGPLKQFQTTAFEKIEFKKLVSVINNRLEDKLPNKILDSVFEKWWPELEVEINKILGDSNVEDQEPVRSEREILEEILELSRITSKSIRKNPSSINPRAIKELIKTFINVHDDQVNQVGGYQEVLDFLKDMSSPISYISTKFKNFSDEYIDLVNKLDELTFKCIDAKDSDRNVDDIEF